ncbi:hypothetical protein L7F22_060626 [Adiantum nelumboides]|nr:hypothetical protein [Adiantum nelumboides]
MAGHVENQPRWFTPERMLFIFCFVNLLNYIDRGTIASNGVNGSSSNSTCSLTETCDTGTGIQGDFGLSNFEDGFLSSAFMVGLLIASPIFAHLAKVCNPFKLIGVGLSVWTFATAACGFAVEFWTISIARMLVGVGEASFISLAAPFVVDNAPENKKTAWLSLFYMCIPVGMALGYVYGGVVGGYLHWRIAFWGEAILMLPFTVFCLNSRPIPMIGKAPFEIVEGGKKVPPILQSKDKIFEADKYVQNTDEAYRMIKLAREKTQSKQKKATDRHRRELVFSLGGWVLLRFEKARLRKLKGRSVSKAGYALLWAFSKDIVPEEQPEQILAHKDRKVKGKVARRYLVKCQIDGTSQDGSVQASSKNGSKRNLQESLKAFSHQAMVFLEDVKTLFQNRTYSVNVLGYIVFTFVLGAYSYWGPRAGYSIFNLANADLVFGAVTVVCGIVGTVAGGLVLDKIGSTITNSFRLLSITTFVGTIFCLASFVSSTLMLFIPLFSLGELFIFATQGPVNYLTLQCVSTDLRPLAMAVSTVCIHVFGDVPSSPLVGLLQDHLGNWRVTTLILTTIFFLAAILWFAGYLLPVESPVQAEEGILQSTPMDDLQEAPLLAKF